MPHPLAPLGMSTIDMAELHKNGIAFLQRRFPAALVLNNEITLSEENGNIVARVWPMIAQDSLSGVMQRALAIEDLGARGELPTIAKLMPKWLDELKGAVYVKVGNVLDPTSHEIDTNQMTYAPRTILYTNKLSVPADLVFELFSKENLLIEIVDESKMHKTVFISFGGPDEGAARIINDALKSKGVKTWFFPDDAEPGAKLHRVMHDGVNEYDRVLLLCSKDALSRPGVLNEIERVLEREAKEGGTDILIPVALDDFVYSDWAPNRADISSQIRSRVIAKILIDSKEFDQTIETHDYDKAYSLITKIQPALDTLFNEVRILADNPRLKHNRIAILQRVFSFFDRLLDFSKIQAVN